MNKSHHVVNATIILKKYDNIMTTDSNFFYTPIEKSLPNVAV